MWEYLFYSFSKFQLCDYGCVNELGGRNPSIMYMFIKSPQCTIFLIYASIQQKRKDLGGKNKVIKSSGDKGN